MQELTTRQEAYLDGLARRLPGQAVPLTLTRSRIANPEPHIRHIRQTFGAGFSAADPCGQAPLSHFFPVFRSECNWMLYSSVGDASSIVDRVGELSHDPTGDPRIVC